MKQGGNPDFRKQEAMKAEEKKRKEEAKKKEDEMKSLFKPAASVQKVVFSIAKPTCKLMFERMILIHKSLGIPYIYLG